MVERIKSEEQNMEKIVLNEMQNFVKKEKQRSHQSEQTIKLHFFGNFPLRLLSLEPSNWEELQTYKSWDGSLWLDKKPGNWSKELLYSEKRRNMTNREFLNEVADTIKKKGINMERLFLLWKERNELSILDPENTMTLEERNKLSLQRHSHLSAVDGLLIELLFPIHVGLREKGFIYQDLT